MVGKKNAKEEKKAASSDSEAAEDYVVERVLDKRIKRGKVMIC